MVLKVFVDTITVSKKTENNRRQTPKAIAFSPLKLQNAILYSYLILKKVNERITDI